MARTEARTKVSIWTNADFVGLSRNSQRVYWLVYSQPTILLCGVVALTLNRWARYAPDDTPEDLTNALKDLEAHQFVVVDWDTEEVFVRSFMRHDGVWRSPRTRGPARGCVKSVISGRLRDAIAVEMLRLVAEDPETGDGLCDTASETVSDGVADRTRAHAHALSSLRSPSPDSDLPLRERTEVLEDLKLSPTSTDLAVDTRAKRRSPISESFVVTDEFREWCAVSGIRSDPDAERPKFMDHHRSKGTPFADPVAGFRSWMRKADDFSKTSTAPHNRSKSAQNITSVLNSHIHRQEALTQ